MYMSFYHLRCSNCQRVFDFRVSKPFGKLALVTIYLDVVAEIDRQLTLAVSGPRLQHATSRAHVANLASARGPTDSRYSGCVDRSLVCVSPAALSYVNFHLCGRQAGLFNARISIARSQWYLRYILRTVSAGLPRYSCAK